MNHRRPSRSYTALAAVALTASSSAFHVGQPQPRSRRAVEMDVTHAAGDYMYLVKSPLSTKPRSAHGGYGAAAPLTVLHAASESGKAPKSKTSKSKTSKSKTSKSKTSKSKTSKSKTSKSKTSKSKTSKTKKTKTKKSKTRKTSKTKTTTDVTAKAEEVKSTPAETDAAAASTAAAATEPQPASEATPEFIEDIQSPGVETLREYLKYSDYGIRKMQNQRQLSEQILAEVESGDRTIPEDFVEEPEPAPEDPNAIVAEEWGSWDERDLAGPPMEGEWDPVRDPNPNVLDPEFEYVTEIPKDEDGVELGYDPIFGSWYPQDERTIINPSESYIIDEKTANATSVPKIFPDDDDPEIAYNADVKSFRKSLKIVETYVDEWTQLEHPRYVARWHGNPALEAYPQKDFMNNRFTKPEAKTDFTDLSPHRARKKAVELARAKNNEWLPRGQSAEYHHAKTKIYAEKGVLAGSFLEGERDPDVVERIRPALDVLGNVADLLSIQDTVFRFRYHGLIKNKRGMAAWTETLIRDCGVDCTGVVFETGTRKRDPWYDHGDHWHGPY